MSNSKRQLRGGLCLTCFFLLSACGEMPATESENSLAHSQDRPMNAAPCTCTLIWNPVCGIDGQTYSNPCQARCENMDIAHTGECQQGQHTMEDGEPCGGPEQIGCPDGEFCNQIIGAGQPDICQLAERTGRCLKNPQFCTLMWTPVCGCDGLTYGSDCFRLMAGAALMHIGACATD